MKLTRWLMQHIGDTYAFTAMSVTHARRPVKPIEVVWGDADYCAKFSAAPVCVTTYSCDTRVWTSFGKHHRVDGPAVECVNGEKRWILNDKLHRVDGPAFETVNGDKRWYLNDELHRVDGPAVEYQYIFKKWHLHGKNHRVDGPAVEWSNGDKEWWENGRRIR